MFQEVYDNWVKEITGEGKKVMTAPPTGSIVPCEMTECIYCLDNKYCGRLYPPRNGDGYCKDFISIND